MDDSYLPHDIICKQKKSLLELNNILIVSFNDLVFFLSMQVTANMFYDLHDVFPVMHSKPVL